MFPPLFSVMYVDKAAATVDLQNALGINTNSLDTSVLSLAQTSKLVVYVPENPSKFPECYFYWKKNDLNVYEFISNEVDWD